MNHPNIVTIYEIGQSNSTSFIVMELVDGKSLSEMLHAGSVPPRKLLAIAASHAHGVNRDGRSDRGGP